MKGNFPRWRLYFQFERSKRGENLELWYCRTKSIYKRWAASEPNWNCKEKWKTIRIPLCYCNWGTKYCCRAKGYRVSWSRCRTISYMVRAKWLFVKGTGCEIMKYIWEKRICYYILFFYVWGDGNEL